MSSHHIVRDEQEPALLIIGLNAGIGEVLAGLLEWSPTVILPEYLIDNAISLGFKFDTVLHNTKNEYALTTYLHEHLPIKFIESPNGQWFDYSYSYLCSRGYDGLNIYTDVFDRTVTEFLSLKLPTVIYDRCFKWHFVNGQYSKWYTQSQELRLLGDKYTLDGIVSNESEGHQFTVLADGKVSINASEPVWLGEKIL